jgi:hypothetical protein
MEVQIVSQKLPRYLHIAFRALATVTTVRSRRQRSYIADLNFKILMKFEVLKNSSWTAWPLKKGPTGCPETSLNNYQSTPRNVPEERRSHTHHHSPLRGAPFLPGYHRCHCDLGTFLPNFTTSHLRRQQPSLPVFMEHAVEMRTVGALVITLQLAG